MPVTATRLGNSPLLLDWSNLTLLHATDLDPSELEDSWKKLVDRFEKKESSFYFTPSEKTLSQIDESNALAQKLRGENRKEDKITDCLFLGIGGSALGPISMLHALEHRREAEKIRFHFHESPDPISWNLTLQNLSPDTTLVCVVTKNGGTFETIAQFQAALEWLGKKRWSSQVVTITDAQKGDLRKFSDAENLHTLTVPSSIGGRFSVFTSVGLFAGSLAGLNMTDFLDGAERVRDYHEKTPKEKNPLFVLAKYFIRHAAQKPIHVCMPYSNRLKPLGDWWVQLWGESLGKDGKGFTPLAALGPTDQHSILQLLRDGPDDKITMFITIDETPNDVIVPAISSQPGGLLDSFNLLHGHGFQALTQTEYRAIAKVLTRRNRPNFTLTLDTLDEKALGALYFSMMLLTTITGSLWDINPFDQPGVDEGKQYIQESLSRGNYTS